MSDADIRVFMGSVERRGPWTVPSHLDVRVTMGNAEIDLREATLEPETTIDLAVKLGNVELFVPPGLAVELAVTTSGGNVGEHREGTTVASGPRVRVTGHVSFGNCEVIALSPGETREDAMRRVRHGRRELHRRFRERRWQEMRAEREMWRYSGDRNAWVPWWLMARMRRRLFSWLTIAFAAGIAVGVYYWDHPRWWHIALAFIGLSIMSGSISWRMTRPLIAAIRAARDIGDGKLDTRLDAHQRGEMRILAKAINEMAEKIQRQLGDQRQLLAAVSHELRTPLGHMRVLIETARDARRVPDVAQEGDVRSINTGGDKKALAELEREVLTLDDLVGRLLASSRLEFGNLERRSVDLGEIASDVATGAGLAPEIIEAIGDVKASIDPTLFRRAVANLVDNARVHGGGAVAVRIERRANQIAVEVDDAGPGVPADRRADAFRAFVPSSGGGLGLGLALVSRIAVAHGGGAWITDRPGGGARVGFTVAV